MQVPQWNNQFVIPGGHIEKGETMEVALRREIMEETNLIYDIQLCRNQYSVIHFMNTDILFFFDYVCKTDSVEVSLNDEANEHAWVERQEILDYDLGGYTRELFTRFLQPEAFRANKVFYNYV